MEPTEDPANQTLGLFEYEDEEFAGTSAEFDYSYWSEGGSEFEDPYFEKDFDVNKQKKKRKKRKDSPRPQPSEYINSPPKKKARAKQPFKEINQQDILFEVTEIEEVHNVKTKPKKTNKNKDLAEVIAKQCKRIDKLSVNKHDSKQEMLKHKLKRGPQNLDHNQITKYFDKLSQDNTSTPCTSKQQQASKRKKQNICYEENDLFTPIKIQSSNEMPLSSIKKVTPDSHTSSDRKSMSKSYDRLSVGSFKRKLLQSCEKESGPEKRPKSNRAIQREQIVDKWAAQMNADFSDIEMHELHVEPQKENIKHIF